MKMPRDMFRSACLPFPAVHFLFATAGGRGRGANARTILGVTESAKAFYRAIIAGRGAGGKHLRAYPKDVRLIDSGVGRSCAGEIPASV